MGERTIELSHNGCTIVLHKPQLTEAEREKREREAVWAVNRFMTDVHRRKANEKESN